MTWQDQLRQLDAEASAGRISPEEYQRRRNELVAAVSGGGPVAPPTGQQQQGPFPPPFRWESSSPESTQLIDPVPAEDPPGHQPSTDATQVVPRGSTHPPPQQEGFGGPLGWGQPGEASTPPWGNSDLPPLGTGTPWIKQGPEVFESDGGSNSGKIIGVVRQEFLNALEAELKVMPADG